MTGAIEGMSSSFSWVFFIVGGIILVVGLIGLGRAVLDPDRSMSGPLWTTSAGILLGGAGVVSRLILGIPGDGSPKAGPTSTPLPSTSTPAPTSEAPRADPIALPKIENPETLWLIPVAIVVLAGAYFLVKRVAQDVVKARAAKAARIAREARLNRKWQDIIDRHRQLEKNYLDAETDWDMLFNYPALTDVTVPTTAAMVRAMQAASDTDNRRPESLDETTDLGALPYPRAVREFELAWDSALRYAKKVGQSAIPKEERKQIKQIRALLALAENSGASESERRVAYERARSLIEKLQSITLPAKAVAAIEEHTRLSLVR